MQKILIERAVNLVDGIEEILNERIAALGSGWQIVSATTSIETCSIWENDTFISPESGVVPKGSPRQVNYVTTVVVKKTE